jgi:hypothetical protein
MFNWVKGGNAENAGRWFHLRFDTRQLAPPQRTGEVSPTRPKKPSLQKPS